MKTKKDSPGVYIPPPLFYAAAFVVAIFVQKKWPIDNSLFEEKRLKYLGVILLVVSLFFTIRSLRQFFRTKNTLILIKPATSLQTNGIYSITRNPMYVGLAFVYVGLSCLIGNWWNFILFPILFVVVQEYIIKSEERYLAREFGKIILTIKSG